MPIIFFIQGIALMMYQFDHNPPHIHVRYAGYKFSITLKDRIVVGVAPVRIIRKVNDFIDSHEDELIAMF